MDAVSQSCLFLPIMSEASLQTMSELESGMVDNVLMEWEASDASDTNERTSD